MSAQAGGQAEWVVPAWAVGSTVCVTPPTVTEGVATDPLCIFANSISGEVRGGHRRDIGVYQLESGNRVFRSMETALYGLRCLRLRPGQ
jgi:hypothetical protein